ncbi:hypothetical protein B0H65DRAFT_523969 [Neurospora tetraspora]|uniref:Uncharacterized protein n=1 Tax=Neurospora tetraspora TaxID=94610 RepID=A0AAE0JEK6_9PEZI|nr:hypothetical protein B0H65DRAFT_523969 [Neurospora tetraspora]
MHLSTLLTTLTTLGLATLTSAAALDTTTSASTGCTNSGLSSTCSASTTATATSASDSNGPESIEEYIKAKQAQIATENSNNNSTMAYNITSARHVKGMNAYEVPMCCVSGCRVCSAMICGKGPSGCNEWPFYSCCSTIILWDTEKNVMLDTFTTEGQTVEFQYD